MNVIIHDGLACLRERLESMPGKMSLQMIFMEAYHSPNLDIWVWDGSHNKKIRRSFIPWYKENRKPWGIDISEGVEYFKELLLYTKAYQVCIDGYEGDDVIAGLVRDLPVDTKIEIKSVDYDLTALKLGRPNLTVDIHRSKSTVAPAVLQCFKTFVGDSSDNIKGVLGFGKGAWEKIKDQIALSDWTHRVCQAGVVTAEDLAMLGPLGVGKAQVEWIENNWKEFWGNYLCVGFIMPEKALIEHHTKQGAPNLAVASATLNRYFLG